MTGTVLERSLNSVIARLQKLRILRRQTACWIVLLVPAIAITLWLPRRPGAVTPELLVVLVTTLVGTLLARMLVRNPSRTEAARLIEQSDPELNDAVITAVQVSDQAGRRPSVLAAMAIQEADLLARQRDWSGAVSSRQIMAWTVLSFLSFVLLVSSVMAANRYGRDLLGSSAVTVEAPVLPHGAMPLTELVIEPGDTELEAGSSLTVVARFPGVVPTHTSLEFMDTNNNIRRMAMTETVDAGVFAARMEEMVADGTYRVLYDQANGAPENPLISPSYQVKTFVRPSLDHVDAIITPPAWTGLGAETVEDVMQLKVTEGSTVTLQLFLNKPVAAAELRPQDGTPIVLTQSPANPAMAETTIVVQESNSWTVFLQDADRRTPADEEQISIKVTVNEPAKIKMTFPGKDSNVSPLQEFLVEANATDDFHLVDYGIQYSLSGGTLQEFSLKTKSDVAGVSRDSTAGDTVAEETVPAAVVAENIPAAAAVAEPAAAGAGTQPIRKAALSHQIEMETLKAQPDDLATYSFWATDIAADGKERRSYSDLMFAEVRRFEDIFREAQQAGQPPEQTQQGEKQQGSAVDGVLKLQKEIISATWNMLRTESLSGRGDTFATDVQTIAESQGQAVQQLEEAVASLGGEPSATELARRAMTEMTSARQKLEDVRDAVEGARLSDALPVEQAVVQSLLKMRAAEFRVQQQQQKGGGGGGGNSASEQQMQQLELDNERNRYESEKQAKLQQEQTQQQREQVQVLNRLKELARRQQMVNERLKQLESELRAATTEKARQEIERELKRLREEQREMLRDVDELAERMEQATEPQNARSSEMKQQMQEARENVQQASRAMDEGRLAEAISEGTRAERQFEDLKEDFRNQTSSGFKEAVRDLREQARELADTQKKLSQQLKGETPGDQKSQKPSLKSERNRDQLQKQFGQQRDRLNRVVEQTKQMVEQAEQTEPLLSNKLYDTLRDLKDSKPEEALEETEFLAGRGMWSQSQEAEQAARRGIEQLTDGIDKAADSVLGSEAESLQRAKEQLEEATKDLAGEVQAATGEAPSQKSNGVQPGKPKDPRGAGNKESEEGSKQDGTKQDGTKQGEGRGKGAQENPERKSSGGSDQKSGEKGSSSDQPAESKSGGAKGEDSKSGESGSGDSKGVESSEQSGTSEPASGSGSGTGASSPSDSSRAQQSSKSSLLDGGREQSESEQRVGGGSNRAAARPLTGDDFSKWSDQLRDIEEMLEDPELRNRVAQVRDRARAMRADFKRHGEMPQWDLVKSQLLGEMQALQLRINQEVARLQSDRAMVPVDREPVPEEFDSLVQRYYELLGQERGPDEPGPVQP